MPQYYLNPKKTNRQVNCTIPKDKPSAALKDKRPESSIKRRLISDESIQRFKFKINGLEGEPLDTEYMIDIHNYVLKNLQDNNTAAIDALRTAATSGSQTYSDVVTLIENLTRAYTAQKEKVQKVSPALNPQTVLIPPNTATTSTLSAQTAAAASSATIPPHVLVTLHSHSEGSRHGSNAGQVFFKFKLNNGQYVDVKVQQPNYSLFWIDIRSTPDASGTVIFNRGKSGNGKDDLDPKGAWNLLQKKIEKADVTEIKRIIGTFRDKYQKGGR